MSRSNERSTFVSLQLAEERISNMRTVRAFGKELSEVNKYTQKSDQVFSLAKKEAVARAGFFGVVSLSSQLNFLATTTKTQLQNLHLTFLQLYVDTAHKL